MAFYVAPDGNYGDADGLVIVHDVPDDFSDWSDEDRYDYATSALLS